MRQEAKKVAESSDVIAIGVNLAGATGTADADASIVPRLRAAGAEAVSGKNPDGDDVDSHMYNDPARKKRKTRSNTALGIYAVAEWSPGARRWLRPLSSLDVRLMRGSWI